MQESVAVFLLIGLFAVMIICHLPVTFAMVIATATTMLYLNIPMMTMVQQMAKSVNSFSLLAMPFNSSGTFCIPYLHRGKIISWMKGLGNSKLFGKAGLSAIRSAGN